jgi:hypothetical protein
MCDKFLAPGDIAEWVGEWHPPIQPNPSADDLVHDQIATPQRPQAAQDHYGEAQARARQPLQAVAHWLHGGGRGACPTTGVQLALLIEGAHHDMHECPRRARHA